MTAILKLKKEISPAIKRLVKIGLQEDLGSGDITTNSFGKAGARMGRGEVLAKENHVVVCGLAVVGTLFAGKNCQITHHYGEGQEASKGETILTITAPLKELLSKERVLLNFLQHLSGIATLTRKWVTCLKKTLGDDTQLLDTRKTLPGYRILQKYAVLCGGGGNHRIGLFDHYLIKDNHIAIARGSLPALKKILEHRARLKKTHSQPWVEIECRNLSEVKEVVEFNHRSSPGADIIMLDNFSIKEIGKALDLIAKSCRVEISGNIDLDKLKKLAPFRGRGITYISAGALTHSVKAVDLSMRIKHV